MTSIHPLNKSLKVPLTELQERRLEEMAKKIGRTKEAMVRYLIMTNSISDAEAEEYEKWKNLGVLPDPRV